MDEILILKARKGDKESFTQAVLQVKEQAYRIAYCYLHNEADSMDAVCDAVEKAYIHIKKLKEAKYFNTWFIRIVINECKLILRSRSRVLIQADSMYYSCGDNLDVEDKLDLDRLLMELPSQDRVMIYMKYYMGYTLEEIAQLMDMSSGTIKTHLYGSLKKLRSRLLVEEV